MGDVAFTGLKDAVMAQSPYDFPTKSKTHEIHYQCHCSFIQHISEWFSHIKYVKNYGLLNERKGLTPVLCPHFIEK